MNRDIKARALFICGAISLIALSCAEARAQTSASVTSAAEDDGAEIGDIIVTAQRRGESLQRVPIAISAFDQASLTQNGVGSLADLNAQAPGVQISSFGRNADVTIRGIGSVTISPGQSPSVSVNLDGVYIPTPSGIGGLFYDMERVEILRGPQGTLYGRNTTGGAINYITNKPVLGELSGNVEATLGTYNRVGVRSALNLPIGDKISVRIAAMSDSRDGYISNPVPGLKPKLAGINTKGVRANLLFKPTDAFSIRLIADYGQDLGDGGNAISLPTDRGKFVQYTNTPYSKRMIGRSITSDINYDVGPIILTSLTSYRRDTSISQYDADQSRSPTNFRANTLFNYPRVFQQEFRAASNSDGPIKYIAGLYYYRSRESNDYELYSRGYYADPLVAQFTRNPNIITTSKAVYGQATYTISSALRFTGGLRYNSDSISDKGTLLYNFDGVTTKVSNPVLPVPIKFDPAKFSGEKLTWKTGAEFDIFPNSLLFANVSTGYKSGGVNTNQQFATGKVFGPENVTAYEIGWKNSLNNGRLILNLSAFHYDYTGLQRNINVQSQGTTQTIVVNAASAKVNGVEFEARYRDRSGFQMRGSLNYLDAHFGSYPNAIDQIGGATNSLYDMDLSGRTLAYAPKWTASAELSYDIKLGNGTLTPRVSTRYSSAFDQRDFGHTPYSGTIRAGVNRPDLPSTITVTNNPFGVLRQGSYTQTRMQLRYTSDQDKWFVMLWVENLENKWYLQGGSSLTFGSYGAVAPPRMAGITAGAKF